MAAALSSVKEAIGPKWKDHLRPPTPTQTHANDAYDDKTMEEEESPLACKEEESKEHTADRPVRKITSANFSQARVEIVKSNAGGRLDELYKWHKDHSTSPVADRKPTVGGHGGGGVGAGGYAARYGSGGYGTGGYGAGGYGAGGAGRGAGGVPGAGGGGFGVGGLGGFGLGSLGAAGLGADMDFRLPLSRLNLSKPY